MQFSTEKYEKQSSYVIQSTEYNNLLHVHNVRVQSEKLLKGVNIHGLTLHLCRNGSFSGIGHPAPPASLQVQLRLPHPSPTKDIHTITLVSSHHTKNQSFI